MNIGFHAHFYHWLCPKRIDIGPAKTVSIHGKNEKKVQRHILVWWNTPELVASLAFSLHFSNQ
jgi:hypothetical protein